MSTDGVDLRSERTTLNSMVNRRLSLLFACGTVFSACSFGGGALNPESTGDVEQPTVSEVEATVPRDDGTGYISFEANPNQVSLHWKDPDGEPLSLIHI